MTREKEPRGETHEALFRGSLRCSCMYWDGYSEKLTHLQQEEDFRATTTFNDDAKWTTGTFLVSLLNHDPPK